MRWINLAAYCYADRAIGRDVAQARMRYTDLATQYIQLYGTVFGSTPKVPGLGFLGVAPLVLAGAAAGFILIAGGLYALIQFIESRPAVAEAEARKAEARVS